MFDLERTEKIAVILLLVSLLAGSGVILYRKTFPSGSLRIEHGRPEAGAARREAPSRVSGKVNINSASAEELASLKGVGDVLAMRIVDHRVKNGPFLSVDDLKKVPGIGEKLLLKIKDEVSLE